MKAYRLTSGTVAIPMRIEFMLTREDLIDALAWSVRNDQPEEFPAPLSVVKAAGTVRDTLHDAGAQNYHYWAEQAPDEVAAQAWAEEIVDRVYGPTLALAR